MATKQKQLKLENKVAELEARVEALETAAQSALEACDTLFDGSLLSNEQANALMFLGKTLHKAKAQS